jgi:hypothetical protein
MALEGNVNSQITDSVTQVMTHVVGHAPSETKGMLDTLMAETIGMAMYNAVTNQHNAQMASNASVIAACARMLKSPTAMPPIPLMTPPKIAVTPVTVPVNELTEFTITGTNYHKSGLSILIRQKDELMATLSGQEQLTLAGGEDGEAPTVTFSYLFPANGLFTVQVQNTGGQASNRVELTVGTVTPKIEAVIPTAQNVFQVVGKHIHPDHTRSLEDLDGNAMDHSVLGQIKPQGFTLRVNSLVPSGVYRLVVTNPGCTPVSKLFTGAAGKVPVATYFVPCDSDSEAQGEPCSEDPQQL